MLKIVTTPAQAIANIHKFEKQLQKSPELQARLPYARAWYAHRLDGEPWCFGPSKFIGYEGIDASAYLETAEESDGRRTEAQLQSYFQTVGPASPLHEELSSALVAFLAKFGKTPSTKARINVLRDRRLFPAKDPSASDAYAAIVQSIVTMAKALPTGHLQEVREQLEDIWS